MPTKKELTKEDKIKREVSRLNRVFKGLDKNKLATVQSIIKTAAFISISLEELQEIINRDGYTHEYQNGANQKGIKQTAEMKTHIDMTRNYTTIMKQLVDLCPPQADEDNELATLMKKYAK